MNNKKVTIELPLKIANWLLLECDFSQAMLDNTIADLSCYPDDSSVKRYKNSLFRDFCNYGIVRNILAKTLAEVLHK